MLDASGPQHLLLAETLGLAMARRASDILDRHRAALAGGGTGAAGTAPPDDDDQFAFDNAIFTAVLDAANECLGRFDTRPADDRWCDALLQVINLAQLAQLLPPGGRRPPADAPRCSPPARTGLLVTAVPRWQSPRTGQRCGVSLPCLLGDGHLNGRAARGAGRLWPPCHRRRPEGGCTLIDRLPRWQLLSPEK